MFVSNGLSFGEIKKKYVRWLNWIQVITYFYFIQLIYVKIFDKSKSLKYNLKHDVWYE